MTCIGGLLITATGSVLLTEKEVKEVEGHIDQLQAENAKLRELVRDFASYRHFDCQHCGYEERCKTQQTNCYKVFVDLFNRTRKLGIEVDGR